MTISRRMAYLEQLFGTAAALPNIDDSSTAANVVWSGSKLNTEFNLKASLNDSVSFLALSVAGRDILTELDDLNAHEHGVADINGLQAALDAKLDDTQLGQPNGIASLDGAGKIPSAQLPAFVDDVIEVANFAALPATGESGKIYVTLDNGKTYRWGGSAYAEISAAPGSTDAVTEGALNKYFTDARAQAALTTQLAGKIDTTGGNFTGHVGYLGNINLKGGSFIYQDAAGSVTHGRHVANATALYSRHVKHSFQTADGATTFAEIDSTGLDVKVGTLKVAGVAALMPSDKAVANGVASLDGTGKVPSAQLPAITATTPNGVTFQATGGAASGATFTGSAALTVSYATVGAAAAGHDHAGVYQLADATLTALAAVNWSAGTQVLALTGTDTFTLKTVGSAAGNLLDKAAGDALYSAIGHTHAYIPTAEKGAANGVATLDGSGLIPSNQLPSFVDDVLEYPNLASFPGTGVSGKIYIDASVGNSYRWTGTVYAEIKGGGGTVTWGNVTGSLANQTDLTTALDGKLSSAGGPITGNGWLSLYGGLIVGKDTTGVTEYGRLSFGVNGAYLRGSKINFQDVAGGTLATINANGDFVAQRGMICNVEYICRGGASEGGQIVLGYGGGLATAIGGQTNNTWNIDVNSSNAFRIFRVRNDGTSSGGWTFAEADCSMSGSGNITTTGNITVGAVTASGAVSTSGANGGLVLSDRDGTGQFVLYNNADTFRVYNGSGDVFSVSSAGNINGGNLQINTAGEGNVIFGASGGGYLYGNSTYFGFYKTGGANIQFNHTSGDMNTPGAITAATINATGNIGAGGSVFADNLQCNAGDPNFILAKWSGSVPTLIQRVDTGNFYFLLSNAGTALDGAFNALRPFTMSLSTGNIQMAHGLSVTGGITADATTITTTGTAQITLAKQGSNTASIFNDGNLHMRSPTNWYDAGGHYWSSENGVTQYGNLGLENGKPVLAINGRGDLTDSANGTTGALRLRSSSASANVYLQITNLAASAQWGAFTFTSAGAASWTGAFTASTLSGTSDERLKKNVRTVEGALDKVAQMRGVHFDWIESDEASSGVIAQEHQKVAPEAVLANDEGILSVNDSATTAYLIEAIKELKGIVEAQASRITELEAK